MTGTVAAAKAAPKTLHQFRNFCYIVVAWCGFNRGFREKRDNDAAWVAHQQKVRQQNVERFQATQAMKDVQNPPKEVTVPAIVPEDMQDLYREVSKSIQ